MCIIWSSSLDSQSLRFADAMGLGEVRSLRSDCLLSCTDIGASDPSTVGFCPLSLISYDSSGDGVVVMLLCLFGLFSGSSCWLFVALSFRFVSWFFASLFGFGGGEFLHNGFSRLSSKFFLLCGMLFKSVF